MRASPVLYNFEGCLRTLREIAALAPAYGRVTITQALQDGISTLADLGAWDARHQVACAAKRRQAAKANPFRRFTCVAVPRSAT